MPRSRLSVAAVLTVAFSASAPSCTLTKPVICAVSSPIIAIGQSGNGVGHGWYGCGCDGEGALYGLAVIAAIGVVGGLVTGLISDINVLRGGVEDPYRNLHDPFATNTSKSSY